MEVKSKLRETTSKLKFSIPIYLLIWLIASLVGFVEGGVAGLALGLATGILFGFLTLTAIVPFAGIPIFMHLATELTGILGSLGVSIPTTMFLIGTIYLAIAIFVGILTSVIGFFLIIKLIAGR